jgi:hypothetical protein
MDIVNALLIDMIERLDKIVTPDSCPRITSEYFMTSIFLPCVKKHSLVDQ